MKDKIAKFVKERKTLIAEFKKWVINKKIPLKERWKVFVDSGLGDSIDGDFPGIDWTQHTFYDDFNMDRGVEESITSILKRAKELDIFEEDGEEEFKEYCLENFCNRIRNEW